MVTNDPTAASDPYAGYGELNGYYTDWETGLQLCGLRYYISAAGRWLNRDPISYAGGVNVYEYCGNGPVGMSDASGLMVINVPGLDPMPVKNSIVVGTIVTCVGALLGFLQAIHQGACVEGSICHALGDCIVGSLCIAVIAEAILDWTAGLGAFWANCLAAAICQGLTTLFDEYVCDKLPCAAPGKIHDALCGALGMGVGCLTGGFVGAGLRAIGFLRPKWVGYIGGDAMSGLFGLDCSDNSEQSE